MLSRTYRIDSDRRKQQIDTLKIFNDNVTEITEGCEYKVVFTAGKTEFTLNVFLGPDFPSEGPRIRITPVIVHPWVTTTGQVIEAPGLLKYTIHSDLGRIVQAIIREFERNPPPLATDVNTGNKEMEAVGRLSPVSQNYVNNYARFDSPASSPPPIYFPDLKNLSLDELQLLNEYEPKQDEFLSNLQQVKEVNMSVETLITQIENIASHSLSKQETFLKKKTEVLEKIEKVAALRVRCEELNKTYQSLSEKYAPSNIQNLLEVAAVKKDNECDAIASSFLDGQIGVDKFLQLFIEAKKSSQICKTKEEKLAHQISELKRKGF